MRIRFTEFFRKDEDDISLYVIQELNGKDYTVHLQSGERKEIIFLEKIENRWNMFASNLPEWVKALKPAIISAIENRVFIGHDAKTFKTHAPVSFIK